MAYARAVRGERKKAKLSHASKSLNIQQNGTKCMRNRRQEKSSEMNQHEKSETMKTKSCTGKRNFKEWKEKNAKTNHNQSTFKSENRW